MTETPLCLALAIPATAIPQPKKLSPQDVLDRIHRHKPELDPGSTTFKAAVVLLAARYVGHNVDRLARFAGCGREFVARVARRLIDNGVWAGNDTLEIWDVELTSEAAFWADVGVAEGLLCRRVAEDGTVQWAPPGYWHKCYDFVQGPTQGGVGVRYSPAAMLDEDRGLLGEFDEDPERGVEAWVDSGQQEETDWDLSSAECTGSLLSAESAPEWIGALPARAPAPAARIAFAGPFPDAVWLG